MGGTPIVSHFSLILAILKIFKSVLTFLGGQKNFFSKVPQKWSSFFKKYIVFFVTLAGQGGGGVRRNVTNVTFFYFLFEGFPKQDKRVLMNLL